MQVWLCFPEDRLNLHKFLSNTALTVGLSVNELELKGELSVVQSSGEPASHRDDDNLESAQPTLRTPGFDFRTRRRMMSVAVAKLTLLVISSA